MTPEQIDVVKRLLHVRDFTKTENTAIVYVLNPWFRQHAQIGDDAWSAFVMAEHWESTLDQDHAKRTPLQKKVSEILDKKAAELKKAVDDRIGDTNEEERMNANLDLYVKKILLELGLHE